ncbi:MAG TPA: metal-sensing transcriptional repressor [Roseomonas sp.]|jgi:DNA-binding FrmR family transcriptional regulator
MHEHPGHPDILARLRRAEGHLRSVCAMLEAEAPCLEIARQLQAVERAVGNAKRALIHNHMDHCLSDPVKPPPVEEFKALAKLL